MMAVTLNGKDMISIKRAHKYIKHKLKLEDYYGENLDALWDLLSTHDQPLEIHFINREDLIEELGDYGEAIIAVFEDAAKENKNIML